MANINRNFTAGRMNKVVDERLVPNGEYIDALNIRMGSTELSEVGVIENSKGNTVLTALQYDGVSLSGDARCIGALEDGSNETIYWFIHDSNFETSPTGKLDLICSYDTKSSILTYHIISINDGSGVNTTLNFNPTYLITGVDLVENLLFFTDDYNAPRRININKNYANPSGGVDGFSNESILVIKKPPIESPSIALLATNGQENFLTDNFICFAYRYRYEDGEYSATSQWSEPAFIPKQFQFSTESYLNEGMTNLANSVNVTIDTGDSLVVGIDLLFKEAGGNIIKVIEKLDKSNLGLLNNVDYTYTFTNSKIFTVLPESEILRLYDNVPRFAKAQTIMGNRLMYGNYVEGYDLIDSNGNPIQLLYEVELISEDIGLADITTENQDGNYTIDVPQTITDSVLSIDLDGVELTQGSSIVIDITLTHAAFSGDTPFPTETTDNVSEGFTFFLPRDYTSVYDLATSDEFQLAMGTSANIEPVATSCDGVTFTDRINCVLPNNLDALEKLTSGVSAVGQGIGIIASPSSNSIGLQFISMEYVNDVVTPTQRVYEYYSIVFAEVTFQKEGNIQSLHSNRDYEIGIVYMDDYNRATTALVSPRNTVHVPCGNSSTKNYIKVRIPPEQKPPYWATRYKFVIKANAENYDTIYTNLFFKNPETNEVWFYLEGENARKVQVGDRYIVKADTDGPLLTCANATVLAKESQGEGFITPIEEVVVPAGVYMKINPNSFSAVSTTDAVVAPGLKGVFARYGGYAVLYYPMNIYRGAGYDPANPDWEYEDYTVPAGSLIDFNIDWHRVGKANCTERGYILKKDLTSLSSYDNMYDWFNGENVAGILNTGISRDGETSIDYIGTLGPLTTFSESINYLRFNRNTDTNELVLQIGTGKSCRGGGSSDREYKAFADIEVFRALNTIIFETKATETLPDVFFENNLSFAIINGNHQGNIENQTSSLPAIIEPKFFNCFAFGNGAESYKILDSIVGKTFNLGNRVTTTSAFNYKESDRFADITYSGVYNSESNTNKLNEFNAGLLNYKSLEVSFGPIAILFARETDILTLQEDKISYVLSGKNLLSDAAAGGAITSVPEVLGTQIARIENYGISNNPESFTSYGYDKYFTDAKRGAVLQLRGSAYSNDQLKVVSEANMRTWFRDLFNNSFGTQKLGAYDPYMNEYVLSSNDISLPTQDDCLDCGITQTRILLSTLTPVTYCVNLGQLVGDVDIDYSFPNEVSAVTISVAYGEDTYTTGPVTVGGVLTFNKSSNSINQAVITIATTSVDFIDITVNCPQVQTLNVFNICLTSDNDAGQFIHNEYRYVDGGFISPLSSELVEFISGTESPLVSQYAEFSGAQGFGSIPTNGSDVTVICNKFGFDDFTFDPAQNKFRYLRSDTLYENNTADINTLLSLSTDITPINTTSAPSTYSASFTMPSTTDEYLYLIWDYRQSTEIVLCYSADDTLDACCGCDGGCEDPCWNWQYNDSGSGSTLEYEVCGGDVTELEVPAGQVRFMCATINTTPTIISGTGELILDQECGCPV
jgi:hypothetical protein